MTNALTDFWWTYVDPNPPTHWCLPHRDQLSMSESLVYLAQWVGSADGWAMLRLSFIWLVCCQVLGFVVFPFFAQRFWRPYRTLSRAQRGECISVFVSTIHCSITGFTTTYAVLNDSALWEDRVMGNSYMSLLGLRLLVAYTLHDTIVLWVYQLPRLGVLTLHHFLAGGGFLVLLSPLGAYNGLIGSLMLNAEAANPLMNAHFFLKTSGYDDNSWPVRIVMAIYLTFWVVFRLVPWWIIWWVVLIDDFDRVHYGSDGITQNVLCIAIGWTAMVFMCALAYVVFFTDSGPFKQYYFGKQNHEIKQRKKKN